MNWIELNPKPSPRMKYILTKYGGFTRNVVPSVPEIGLNYVCELWVKEPMPRYA